MPQRSKASGTCEVAPGKELGEPLGPADLSVLFPEGENAPQYLQGPGGGSGTHSRHSAGSVPV